MSKKVNKATDDKSKQQPSKLFKRQPEARQSSIWQQLVLRFLSITGVCVAAHFYLLSQLSEESFAKSDAHIKGKFYSVPCSDSYSSEKKLYQGCVANDCGRGVSDDIITSQEAQVLLSIAKDGLALGGSNGGASVLDIHTGALSKGDKFINLYLLLQENQVELPASFTEENFNVYSTVRKRIHQVIANQFDVPVDQLYLTSPTFFSRMTNKPAQTVHDEYWHVHIDKETYGSFHYTSLIYLTTYGQDFEGGRFVFVDPGRNMTVEPRQGRLSFFTSGEENPHFVEKVMSGTRYAVTVSFTCDRDKAIDDPVLTRKLKTNK